MKKNLTPAGLCDNTGTGRNSSPLFSRAPLRSEDDEKETSEEYNARVRAAYEAKMQAYDDSTASYQNQIEIDRLLGEAIAIEESEPDIFINPRMDEVYRKRKLAEVLHMQNVDRGVAPVDRPDATSSFYLPGYDAVRNSDDSGYTATGSTHPEDLRPTKPREPIEMIDRIETKNIEMLPTTTKIPDIIEPSKRKYITSRDGKWKYNLETGEKTRVKTEKVKKYKKPGKRSVRNLVTGGTNRVQ